MSYYVDTNIFDYSALAHPVYGKACKRIIDDIQNEKIQAHWFIELKLPNYE